MTEKLDAFGLPTPEQEMIIDLFCDTTFKQMFKQKNNIVRYSQS